MPRSSRLPPIDDTGSDTLAAIRAEYDQKMKEALRVVNHEVRTPLSAAISAVQMLMDRSFDEDAQELVSAIGSSLESAQAAVDDTVTSQKCKTESNAVSSIQSSPRPVPLDVFSEVPHGVIRVLVVDDSPLCRKMLIRRINRDTIQCDEAIDGEDAVRMVLAAKERDVVYAGILMDNTMPRLTGPLAAQRIRELGYAGKIYGVTGNIFDDDVDAFVRSGANAVYTKPLHDSKLEGILNDIKEGAAEFGH